MNTNITWDDVPTQAMCDDDDTAKCYSCNGWFPVSSCVLNTEDDGTAVPVCERCASGKVHSPRADWSEGSYHDTMRKAADAKRKQYGTTTSYNGY